jgi:hypothetical protein
LSSSGTGREDKGLENGHALDISTGHPVGNRCLIAYHSRLWGHREGMAHSQEREEQKGESMHGNHQISISTNISSIRLIDLILYGT